MITGSEKCVHFVKAIFLYKNKLIIYFKFYVFTFGGSLIMTTEPTAEQFFFSHEDRSQAPLQFMRETPLVHQHIQSMGQCESLMIYPIYLRRAVCTAVINISQNKIK
jgi:hypothetical protein